MIQTTSIDLLLLTRLVLFLPIVLFLAGSVLFLIYNFLLSFRASLYFLTTASVV